MSIFIESPLFKKSVIQQEPSTNQLKVNNNRLTARTMETTLLPDMYYIYKAGSALSLFYTRWTDKYYFLDLTGQVCNPYFQSYRLQAISVATAGING